MKTLFYKICEVITEHVTGLVNGEMELWELEEYLTILSLVKPITNLVIAISVTCVIIVCVQGIMCVHDVINKKI